VVDVVHPKPAPRWRAAMNLVLGVPHYRTRFATAENRRLVTSAYQGHEVTICSWEPLDVLAPTLTPPVILIAHNVTSLALPQLFPGNRLVGIAARQAARWEGRLFTSPQLAAIFTLSRRDQSYVADVSRMQTARLIVPGMPPVVPLSPQAELRHEIVLSGTFDWKPKRRDIVRFAREYALERDRLPVFAGSLPEKARAALPTMPALTDKDAYQAIRFGLITDRFEAGHKLKTLAYIAYNQIVLSFSDAAHDFEAVPDHDFFIRRVASVGDIARQIAEVSAVDIHDLRERLVRFQQDCAERFSWHAVGSQLTSIVERSFDCAGLSPDHPSVTSRSISRSLKRE
jgi:hypothetical protein